MSWKTISGVLIAALLLVSPGWAASPEALLKACDTGPCVVPLYVDVVEDGVRQSTHEFSIDPESTLKAYAERQGLKLRRIMRPDTVTFVIQGQSHGQKVVEEVVMRTAKDDPDGLEVAAVRSNGQTLSADDVSLYFYERVYYTIHPEQETSSED